MQKKKNGSKLISTCIYFNSNFILKRNGGGRGEREEVVGKILDM